MQADLSTWIWWGLGGAVLIGAVVMMILRSERQRRSLHLPASTAVREFAVEDAPVRSGVRLGTIRAQFQRDDRAWSIRSAQVQSAIQSARARAYEDMAPEHLLLSATGQERNNLVAILCKPASTTPAELIQALRKAGSHTVMSWIRKGHVEYAEVVGDVARKMEVAIWPESGLASIEREVVGAAFQKALASATPEQRNAMLAALAHEQGTTVKTLVGASGVLVAANLTGFGLYVAASTMLGAMTGALGVALPFAVYTGMSGVIATLTGPVGWAMLAGWAVYRFGSTDYKKTVPGVIAVAAVRARLMAERDCEIEKLLAEQSGQLAEARRRLDRVRVFLIGLGSQPDDHRIQLGEVPG